MLNRLDIKESDWKKWKQLRLQAIDRYCATTFAQVQEITDGDASIHDRHRDLHELVSRRDKEIVQLFDPLTRSRTIGQLMNLHRGGLVSNNDLMQFSDELQAAVRDFAIVVDG